MSIKTVRPNFSHFTYLFLLLVVSVFAYWQISFLKYSVTHDMINCWIPWRYYISECFQNHEFPFWNPYQQLGYPIHADLQGPTWYLESLLLSITTGQSNYTVQLLFVFYTFLAGTGMYFLSLCFHNNRSVAFLTGVCYMLSGFFVAHVQHFYAIIGAAWLPFIILNYYKMHVDRDYKRAIYASLFMFFNLTGGNHTFTFILSYLFIFISGYFIITAIKEKKHAEVFQLFKLNALFVFITAILSTVVLVAFWQVHPYIERLSGLSYQDASFAPFSPQSLLSFLIPYATVNNAEYFNTDPSMCNAYIGLLMLPFIILALISKKSVLERTLLAFAFVCLFASFGAYTPVHKILFKFFPFINLFRFPSYFSLFTIMIFLLLGGKQFALIVATFELNRKKLLQIVIGFILLISIIVIVAFVKNGNHLFYFLQSYHTIFDFIKSGDIYQNIILQGTIQLFLFVLFAIILFKSSVNLAKVLYVLMVIDMMIATQLNIAYVGFSQTSPKELHDYVKTLPKGFPIPSGNNISENTEEMGQKHGLYRNTSGFHKRISADVFNSFCFKNMGKLVDSFPQLFDSMLHNPLVYFSDQVCSAADFEKKQIALTHKTIVLNEMDYRQISPQLNSSLNDTPICNITGFKPDKITIAASTSKGQVLTLLQSQYTGWQVFIDNRRSQILVSNYLTMSVFVPNGKHVVEFIYKNPAIVIGGIVSYSAFFILLILISVIWIREKKHYFALALIWFVLLGSLTYYFF